MYEPYGYQDNANYISKKDQIERELQQNRINDCKEFASVEYDTTLKAFVFKNVKNQVRGYAYMADIIPSDLIADVYYDTETKNLIITFVNGKVVSIPLNDLIDVVEAGNGLKFEDGKFHINLSEDCERFLTVDENGLKLSGVQDAINVERDRAISAETEEYDRATQAEESLASAIRQEVTDRSTNDNLIRQTIGNDFTTNPTETVSYKFNLLSEKVQKEIDDRGTAVSQEAQLRELGDSNLSNLISQETTARASDINNLENTKANKADVYTKDDVYTKEESDNKFQIKGNYLTIDSLSGYATEAWVENKGYLTEHQSLSGYATEAWVGEQGFLTEHQDISALATKEEVNKLDEKIEGIDLTPYATIEDTNTKLELKADKEVTYTKEQVDAIVAEKQTEIDKIISDYKKLKEIVGDLGGDVEYSVPADGKLTDMLKKSGIIKLTEDVESNTYTGGITSKNITTLNLNGKTITTTANTTTNPSIMVRGTQQFTIQGSGTLNANGHIAIEANGEDAVITLGGTAFGRPTYVTNREGELIYSYLGTINITNGVFRNDNENKKFLLNCYDANYKNGTAKIVVTGGKFYDFDPANNTSEGEGTSYVPEGYVSVESTETIDGVEHKVYTVKKA